MGVHIVFYESSLLYSRIEAVSHRPWTECREIVGELRMLEQIEIHGQGFQPLKDYGSWRMAQLSYDPSVNDLDSLSSLGCHYETEEAFLLLQGEAVMVTAGTGKQPRGFEAVKLVAGRIYVVAVGQWHAAVLRPDTRLLIVENRGTGSANSENHTLTHQERLEVGRCVAQVEIP
jgi:mannose-6-phosphate isomerase-like protein (cupin superfamily)